MLRSFLFNWISAQYSKEVKDRIYGAAADAFRDAVSAEEPDTAGGVAPADIGLLFARSAEYGCLTDRLENLQVTKGNGLKFTQGTYKRLRLAIVETGGEPARVREGVFALLQVFQPRRVIAAGFAAALVPEVKRGELFLPLELYSETGEEANLAQAQKESSETCAEDTGLPLKTAPIVTVSALPGDPAQRRLLHEKTGARLADTLVWHAAAACREARFPFLALKVAAVELNDRLPAALQRVAESGSGSPARKLGAFFGALTNRPSSLLDVYKVKERELEAADRLADALAGLLTESSKRDSAPLNGEDSV